MRNILLFILMLPIVANAQLCHDFESGNTMGWIFNYPGRWDADTLAALFGNFSLHHIYDNPDAGTDMAAIPLEGVDPDLGMVTWSFALRHGYAPSSSNRWGVYLVADMKPEMMEPGSPISGYVVGVNQSGYDDTLRLWKIDSGILSVVVSMDINWQNDIGVDSVVVFRVERSIDGKWTVNMLDAGGDVRKTGNGSDPELFYNGFFGISYKYSSSQDRLFWIDNISITGRFVQDTLAPQIIMAEFIGSDCLELVLSETLAPVSMQCDNFSLLPMEATPSGLISTGINRLRLLFSEPIPNKQEYLIKVTQLCDLNNNCSANAGIEALLAYPEWGDVILTELLIDPIPYVGLPEREYLEIYNRSVFPFSTESITLTIGDKKVPLDGPLIEPGEFYILCNSGDSGLFARYGKIITAPSPRQLSDKDDLVLLKDTADNVIHGVDYDESWFTDQLKSEGGWSLEMVDRDYPFAGMDNWQYSKMKTGGTPGTENSINSFNPDSRSPKILNVFPGNDSTVMIELSEPFIMGEGIPLIRSSADLAIRDIVSSDPLRRRYLIRMVDKLSKRIIYSLELPDGATDVAGNSAGDGIYQFGLPEDAEYNDLIFNEIMFDPLPWEAEYIEFYNRSEKTLDASRLLVFSINGETGDTGSIHFLSEHGRCMIPGTYYVITDSKKELTERFLSINPDFIFELNDLPSMPDDKGDLVLYNRYFDLIDRVHYSSDMHFDLLASLQGVSIERIDPDKPTNDPGNWGSASSLSGWGTPGLPNSACIWSKPALSSVSLSSRRITPNNDGYEDYLVISFSFSTGDQLITAVVYNDSGFKINTLAENSTCGYDEKLVWNGTKDGNGLAEEGIYILFVKAVGPAGDIQVWKKVCTLIRD